MRELTLAQQLHKHFPRENLVAGDFGGQDAARHDVPELVVAHLAFIVQGLGFWNWGLGFGVKGLGFRVWGLGETGEKATRW